MTLRLLEFVVGGNEASDLLPVRSTALLRRYSARRGFWTVLDEGPVENCLALLLERDDGEWTAEHVDADAGPQNGRTEDGEALAHHDGWVYVFGSHFGSKAGPLRPRRAFVARFREADAADGPVQVQVVRNAFRLHRTINDALAAALTPLPPGEQVHTRFVVETISRGTAREKNWVSRLTEGDLPLNVEAAAFTPTGSVLLGLRFPVTADGEPILVELTGVEGMFADPRSWPRAVGAYALTGVSPPGVLTGFRAIAHTGDGGYAAIVGSIDALGKGSVLLDEHPHAGEVTSRHVRFTLPADETHLVGGDLVADLAPFHHVEGLAEVEGQCFYVTDEDHRVALWVGD